MGFEFLFFWGGEEGEEGGGVWRSVGGLSLSFFVDLSNFVGAKRRVCNQIRE